MYFFIVWFIPLADGDINVAGLFNVHLRGKRDTRYWKRCGKIDPQYGIMFVEAMLFAIDRINSDPSFLHGLRLRTQIHFTCGDKRYLRNALARIAKFASQGVVGPQYSDDAIVTSTVMNIFGKNTISYSATSPDLENRIKHNYFYRTVPSDTNSVRLLLSLALKFNWKYIALIRSQGSYGQRSSELFRNAAEEQGICIPLDKSIPDDATSSDYEYVLKRIQEYKSVTVVYLILKEFHLIEFFKTAERMKNQTANLNFVVGDGWGGRSFVAPGSEVANGTLTFQVEAKEVPEFKDYFLKLKPHTNRRNIWFKQFWEETFECSLKNRSNVKLCTGKEELKEGVGYFKETPILNVINAVYAYGNAFKNVIWEECLKWNSTVRNCSDSGMLKGIFSYRNVLNFVAKTKFMEPFRNRVFEFSKNGDYDENYRIYNFVASHKKGGDVFKEVGTWNNLVNRSITFNQNGVKNTYLQPEAWRLTLDVNNITWKTGTEPVSICSKACDLGFIRQVTSKCCWTCKKCEADAVIRNNTCISCHVDSVPDPLKSYCVPLPVNNIWVYREITIAILCLSSFGIISTLAVAALILKNFNRRLIKASGRELCLLMLIGISLAFSSPMAFVPPPSAISCNLQRLVVGISLTACYAPLLLRTNRIYRIFRSAKTTASRPSMISPRSQIVMSLALTGIACLIGLVSILGRDSQIKTAYPTHREYIIRYCELSEQAMLVNLSFSSALMIATTWFAVKTRNFPKNYNEAKYIGFTMYLTCLVLAVILTIFFFVREDDVKTRTILLCCVCWTNATLNLVGLFGNKVKMLLSQNVIELDLQVTTMADTATIHMQRTGISCDVFEQQQQQQQQQHYQGISKEKRIIKFSEP